MAVLLVNTATGSINAIEVMVGGLFTTVTKSHNDDALRLPIDTAHAGRASLDCAAGRYRRHRCGVGRVEKYAASGSI